jgi:quinol monooxygenase YgiN
MDQRITVFTRYKAMKGSDHKLKELLLTLIEPSRSEEGSIKCELHQAINDPTIFIFYEIWESKEYFDKHSATSNAKDFRSKAKDLLAEPPEKKVWDKKAKKLVKDPQTGALFELEDEQFWWDGFFALLSFFYLFFMLLFLLWMLISTWIESVPFMKFIFGSQYAERFNYPLFRLFAYAGIGGALGAVASGIRSVYYWHIDLKAFGARFFLRDFARPILGAFLAVVVYALVIAISGDILKTDIRTAQSSGAFSVGVLAGYSWHAVFVWFDYVWKRAFRLRQTKEVVKP